MSNDKSDVSDMPDVMFIAKDEMSNDHYLAGDNREEGDTEYVRRSLVDELKATIKAQAAEIEACKMIMSATADEIIRLEALVKSQEDK